MPRCTSMVKKPQTLVPDRFFQAPSGQVSAPGSPVCGAVWKVQRSLPVRASQPRISPYAPAVGEPSPLLEPVITTSPKTAGGDCKVYRPFFNSPNTPSFK